MSDLEGPPSPPATPTQSGTWVSGDGSSRSVVYELPSLHYSAMEGNRLSQEDRSRVTPGPCAWRPPALAQGTQHMSLVSPRVRQRPPEGAGELGPLANFPKAQTGHSGPGSRATVTLDLDPGLGVTQGPDVHHHVHATGCKVLVVWGPGQADDLRVVSIEDVVLLVAGRNRKLVVRVRARVARHLTRPSRQQ